MHEMSVVTSMLSIVQDEMDKHNVHTLLLVRVRYGDLANIVPEAMAFAFEALTQGTPLEGAQLELERVPVTLRCPQCNTEFTPPPEESFFAPCPNCKTQIGHTVVTGRELYIQHIEAE